LTAAWWTTRFVKTPAAWLVMMPLRASRSAPPRTMPLVRAGLSPSSVRPLIVTSFAWTRTRLLAPGQSDAPAHGFAPESEGRSVTTPAPAPASVSGCAIVTCST
jgi:hypothetical protein